MRLQHGNAVVALSVESTSAVRCTMWLDNVADAQAAVQRCRRLLDLDADPVTIDEHLAADAVLRPLIARRPGLRSPGHPDGTELFVRAVLGQQVSVKGARTLAARIVERIGEPLASPIGAITHVFPTAAALAEGVPEDFAMPRRRGAALIAGAAAIAAGDIVIDSGSDRREVARQLCALPGIGPWTASYVAMRALNDPDVFLATDLGVRHALSAAGLPSDAAAADRCADAWRPWRSYALHHLWASLPE
jgi:AraC family transcriptional regulator of adaptative response / DNA-3-methyladenine glycosylase II